MKSCPVFASQIPNVLRVSLSKIGSDLDYFRRQVKVLQRELEAEHPDRNDGFVKFIKAFSDKAKRKLEVTEALYKQMIKEFDKLWVLYGYELDGRTDKTIAAFWTTLSNFRNNTRISREKNERAEKQQKEMEERARAKAERKQKRRQHAPKKKSKKGLFELMEDDRKGSAAEVIKKQKLKIRNSVQIKTGRRGVRRIKKQR